MGAEEVVEAAQVVEAVEKVVEAAALSPATLLGSATAIVSIVPTPSAFDRGLPLRSSSASCCNLRR